MVSPLPKNLTFPSWNGLDLWLMLPEKMYQHREIRNVCNGLLIDPHPFNHNTVLTILVNIKSSWTSTTIKYHSFQCWHVDIQLYKVVMQVKWSNPGKWKHLMVSFIGHIGTVITSFGLEEIFSGCWKDVSNMLSKAWPKVFCDL